MKPIDEKEAWLIRECTGIFMRFGIKSVNMDDLAARLGVSKKTIYKYVNDKNELVGKVLFHQMACERDALNAIASRELNAIDESFEIMRMVMDMVKDLHPAVLYDIQKYHPEVMREMESERTSMVYSSLIHNMEKGVREGLYRDDLKPDFIASLYVSAVESIFHNLTFKDSALSFQELYLELFRYHIRGIASEKGIAYLVEKIKNERQAPK